MTNSEYEALCGKIISSTMQYINTSKMKRYKIDKSLITSNNGAIYNSAVASTAPITLVYAPSGTGKSALAADRARALEAAGVQPGSIIILNMNVAKVKQMQSLLPGTNVMTFSDFVHGITKTNIPELELSDMGSIANELRMCQPDSLTHEFISRLSIRNPRDRISLLTLFINKLTDGVIDRLKTIGKSEYAIDGMICQNMMYKFKSPYNAEAIIINGVHNMPVPVLCSVLEYASMHGCNLFMTGAPDESIYDFNMSYGGCLDILSSYTGKDIDIIRLDKTQKIPKSIKDLAMMQPNAKLNPDEVTATHLIVDRSMNIRTMLQPAIGTYTKYIRGKLDAHESIMILACSKADVTEIKQTVEDVYRPMYPNMKVLDMTCSPTPNTSYGELASKNYNNFMLQYPGGMSAGQLFYELYNILSKEISESPYVKYENDRNSMQAFLSKHINKFGPDGMNRIHSVKEIITILINIESDEIQKNINEAQNNTVTDISDYDIILSTIHSASDIHCDNVIVFMKNNNDKIDEALYRVALTRADKSEYLIFANYGNFKTSYQRYIETHM